MKTCNLVIKALYPSQGLDTASAALIFAKTKETLIVGVEGVILKGSPVTVVLPGWCRPEFGLRKGEFGTELFEYHLEDGSSDDPYTVLNAEQIERTRWRIGNRNLSVYVGELPPSLLTTFPDL